MSGFTVDGCPIIYHDVGAAEPVLGRPWLRLLRCAAAPAAVSRALAVVMSLQERVTAKFAEHEIRDFFILWLEYALELQAESQRKRLNPAGGHCLVRMDGLSHASADAAMFSDVKACEYV